MARLILVIGFSMEKVTLLLLDFSESFVACDLEVGRYRQHIKLMKLFEYSRSRSSNVIYILNVKLYFSETVLD